MLAFIENFNKIDSKMNVLERRKLKSRNHGILEGDIEELMFLINIFLVQNNILDLCLRVMEFK